MENAYKQQISYRETKMVQILKSEKGYVTLFALRNFNFIISTYRKVGTSLN